MVHKALSLLSVLFSLGHSSPIYGGQDVGRLLTQLPENKIVAVGQDQFPFMTYITCFGEKIENGVRIPISLRCGGVIISEDIVLTAGHCISDSISKPSIHIRAGLVDLKLESETAPRSWARGYVKYEGFVEHHVVSVLMNVRGLSDIAIIWLEKPFSFNGPNVKKAHLTTSEEPFDNTLGWIIGWGHTSNRAPSDMLQKAQTRVIPNAQCQMAKPFVMIMPDMFCLLSDTRTVTSCVGDSGGPFVVGNTVYGISSFGPGAVINGQIICNPAVPAVFTHIGMYKEWIEEKLKEGPKNLLWPPSGYAKASTGKSTSCGSRRRRK